jgi:hypothetical protein
MKPFFMKTFIIVLAAIGLASCTRSNLTPPRATSDHQTDVTVKANQFTVQNHDSYATLDSFSINGVMYRTAGATPYAVTVDSLSSATLKIYCTESFTQGPGYMNYNCGAFTTENLMPNVFPTGRGSNVDSTEFDNVPVNNNAEITMVYSN